jgi:arylsulfatase A-like enzyme
MQEIESWYRGEDGLPHLKGRRRATGEFSPGRGIHGSSLNDWIRQYHQGVLALDEAVGKLIATLVDTGQYDNTLIVFTSDQGFAWGQHGFRAKVAPYDANIRSPLIVSMPQRFPRGAVCATPAGGVDLAPTFFELAGIKLPWKMHGRSLVPLLENPDQAWSRPLLMTFTGRYYGADTDTIPTDTALLRKVAGVPWYASLHDGRFKYIRTFEENEIEELYDLQTDPEELNNLASNREHRAHLQWMRGQTVAELRRTDAGFVDSLPAVR